MLLTPTPVVQVLAPLYQRLEQGAATANEQAFVAAHGADLQRALSHCRDFTHTGNEAQLHEAWSRFYEVLRSLARALQEAKTLQLGQVSPQLLQVMWYGIVRYGTVRYGTVR